jgi:hypothetical protein
MVAQQLGAAERRLQPVAHRHPVPQQTRARLHRRQAEHRAGPGEQRGAVVRYHALVDAPSDRHRDESLRDHPHSAPEHAEGQVARLLPSDPHEEAPRAT